MHKNIQKNSAILPAAAAIAVGGIATAFAARALLRAQRRIDLRAKSVLVTGGSRGLGILIARRFLDAGANVTICARTPEDVRRAQAELNARAPGRAMGIVHDITAGPLAAQELIDKIVAAFGSIDVLVNNAAIIQVGPAECMTEADYRQAMDITFWGAFHLIEAALPHMRQNGRGGRIVNIASIGGKIAVPHLLPYSAAKFAIAGYSEGLRAELAKDRIFVTTVYPGLIHTGSPPRANFKGQHEKEYAWFAASDALPLLAANPDRLARQIVNAAQHGDSQVMFPLLTALQIKTHALAPGLFAEIFALVNRYLLPAPGGIGTQSAPGNQSDRLEPRFTRRRNRSAAANNNQFGR